MFIAVITQLYWELEQMLVDELIDIHNQTMFCRGLAVEY